MVKRLNSEKIQGVEFFFQDMGDAVIVSMFGYLDDFSSGADYVAAFNTKEEAVEQLRKAKIYKQQDGSYNIKHLKSINEMKVWR